MQQRRQLCTDGLVHVENLEHDAELISLLRGFQPRRRSRQRTDRASILVDTVLGIFIAIFAAAAIDKSIAFFGLENSFAYYRMETMFQTAQEDGRNLGDSAIFISSTSDGVTLTEAQAASTGSYSDPYTGKTLAENYADTFSGTMTATVNGTTEALPLTIAAGPDGSLYAAPSGSSTPCTSIVLTLTYTGSITQTTSVTIPCGGS